MRKNWQILVVLAGIWLGITSIGKTQLIDTTWVKHHAADHFVSGILIDNLVRGPWVAKSWRNSAWKRTAWAGSASIIYETIQATPVLRKAFGMTWEGKYPTKYIALDVLAGYTSAWVSEGLIFVGKKIL